MYLEKRNHATKQITSTKSNLLKYNQRRNNKNNRILLHHYQKEIFFISLIHISVIMQFLHNNFILKNLLLDWRIFDKSILSYIVNPQFVNNQLRVVIVYNNAYLIPMPLNHNNFLIRKKI